MMLYRQLDKCRITFSANTFNYMGQSFCLDWEFYIFDYRDNIIVNFLFSITCLLHSLDSYKHKSKMATVDSNSNMASLPDMHHGIDYGMDIEFRLQWREWWNNYDFDQSYKLLTRPSTRYEREIFQCFWIYLKFRHI